MRPLAALSLLCSLAMPAPTEARDDFVCPDNGNTLQQLRVYEIPRHNRDAFHARFRDHALRIMQRHDFTVVDMWESDTGEKLEFVYVLSWSDRETMDARWAAFLADQEWIDIKRATAAESGELVRDAVGQPLVRLSYSPACAQR